MKIDDLVLLIKAGYSKEDIENLGVFGNTEVPEVPVELKPEEVKPEEVKPEVHAEQDNDRLSKLETKLDYVINRFNYMNVQQSAQPAEQKETVDDILASMIRK